MYSRDSSGYFRRGFTIIELLTVMLLIAILGATALSAFIDFRLEARAAVVRRTIDVIRVGIKNQIQQAVLRCGAGPPNTYNNSRGRSLFSNLANALFTNDITASESPGFPFFNVLNICTDAQISNPTDRLFWQVSTFELAHSYTGLNDTGVSSSMPKNALLEPSAFASVVPIFSGLSSSIISTWGGRCGVIDYVALISLRAHWLYNPDTGDIFAGTNTPGISECNF